jgi:hypothetical protein
VGMAEQKRQRVMPVTYPSIPPPLSCHSLSLPNLPPRDSLTGSPKCSLTEDQKRKGHTGNMMRKERERERKSDEVGNDFRLFDHQPKLVFSIHMMQ